MSPRNIKVGCFVLATGSIRNLGIGKVTAVSGESVTVEHFHAVGCRTLIVVPISQVQMVERLASQRPVVQRVANVTPFFDDSFETSSRPRLPCLILHPDGPVSPAGSRLGFLTDTVRSWLTQHGIMSSFVIKVSS
jgi:hypothetical protein